MIPDTPEPTSGVSASTVTPRFQGGTVNNTSSTIVADTGLTTEEITTASRHLSVTRGFLLESVGGLSPAQWDFKPASDAWSVAENMEHIVLIESWYPCDYRTHERSLRATTRGRSARNG